jgi:hypothetical protein
MALREMPLPKGKFLQVTGGWPGCGLRTDGIVLCWGSGCRQKGGQVAPKCSPGGVFQQISGGLPSGCGILTDGTIRCWGNEGLKEQVPRAETFRYVSEGFDTACAVRKDTGGIACWGQDSDIKSGAPAGAFKMVSVGGFFACAVRTDGSIACWGRSDFGETTPPE